MTISTVQYMYNKIC